MRMLAIICLLVAATGIGCVTNPERGILLLTDLSQLPDTTYEEQVSLSGRVVRSPPMANIPLIMVVTVTGGATTVADTANLNGLFDVTIPLVTNADNDLVATATDNAGSTMPDPGRWTVVQVDTTNPPPTGAGR
ncbi:MAG: hypothetical protein JSW71_16585 [Gemmatimonadota bacterium]|nr:MAG: hypothetical protein JSW71_16585 [Gemmatimonadota bacterium]